MKKFLLKTTPILAAALLFAGTTLFAGCEKEKDKAMKQTVNESNYENVLLEEYVNGIWIAEPVRGIGEAWTDTIIFANNNWYYHNCDNFNCKYKCSDSGCDTIFLFTGENSFYPLRIKRLGTDSMLLYEQSVCHSFAQVVFDVKFNRLKN